MGSAPMRSLNAVFASRPAPKYCGGIRPALDFQYLSALELHHEITIPIEELIVDVDLTPLAQIVDHVPMDA
jgi:hypothetical protein